MDVCLVNMPFTTPVTPSAALGVLQAGLNRAGLSTRTVYANLAYCEIVSFQRAGRVTHCSRNEALGDWIFAGVAFPEFSPPDQDAYLRRVFRQNFTFWSLGLDEFKRLAWSFRNDAAAFVERIADQALALRPRAIGCTSTYTQHVAALALLRRIRERAPGILTLMGGGNCLDLMGRTTHRCFPWIDIVVSGEADDLLPDLLHRLLDRGADMSAADLPKGVFAPCHRREGYPGTDTEAPKAMVRDINTLPIPDYSDYFATLDQMPTLREIIHPGLLIEGSRGCWWNRCLFCALPGHGRAFRSKTPERILEELDTLAARHGSDRFHFTDSLFDPRHVKTLFPRLAQRHPPMRLFYEMKSNLSRNTLQSLWAAGFRWIQPGIESFSTPHLAWMQKGAKAWQHVRLIKQAREIGFHIVYNLLHGLPGEQDAWLADMAQLVPWLTHLEAPMSFARMRFDRFNWFVRNRGRFDLNLVVPASYHWIYPLPDDAIAGLVYSFVLADEEAIWDNPYLKELTRSEAECDLTYTIRSWQKQCRGPHAPVLSWHVEQGRRIVRDTRAAAAGEKTCALSEIESALLAACDDGLPEDAMTRTLARWSADDLQRARAALVNRRFLLSLDGHLLNLVMPEPVPSISGRDGYGGGSVDKLSEPEVRRRLGYPTSPDSGCPAHAIE